MCLIRQKMRLGPNTNPIDIGWFRPPPQGLRKKKVWDQNRQYRNFDTTISQVNKIRSRCLIRQKMRLGPNTNPIDIGRFRPPPQGIRNKKVWGKNRQYRKLFSLIQLISEYFPRGHTKYATLLSSASSPFSKNFCC